MGEKGSKQTTEATSYATRLVDTLAPIGKITSKKMFGGQGVFHDGVMFGIIDPKGGAYLKADVVTAKKMEQAGSHKHGKMPYYSIPLKALNDDKELIALVRKSIASSK